jgi:hypothetical protein
MPRLAGSHLPPGRLSKALQVTFRAAVAAMSWNGNGRRELLGLKAGNNEKTCSPTPSEKPSTTATSPSPSGARSGTPTYWSG